MAKKILLVDDEPAIIMLVQRRLQSVGYDVIVAEDGQEGLNKARSENPDLIILDVMLPKMEGFRVAQFLKLDDQYRHIPILMLTARVQKDDRQMGEKIGADAYMTKPFEAEQLLATIKKLLEAS